LQGKKATGWNGDGELGGILSDSGAEFVDKPVVVDGNIVTGNGPSAAKEWGEAIVKMLLN
jgi:putative intracellular protease/amidase